MVLKRNKATRRVLLRPLNGTPAVTNGLRPRYWGKVDVPEVDETAGCETQWAQALECFEKAGFREQPCKSLLTTYQECMEQHTKMMLTRKHTNMNIRNLVRRGGIKEKYNLN